MRSVIAEMRKEMETLNNQAASFDDIKMKIQNAGITNSAVVLFLPGKKMDIIAQQGPLYFINLSLL